MAPSNGGPKKHGMLIAIKLHSGCTNRRRWLILRKRFYVARLGENHLGRNRCQFESDSMSNLDAVRARFARKEGLPFADILTEASIRDVLDAHGVKCQDRVFSPVTTIWGFLS